MKKNSILVIVCALFCLTASAQQRFKFGVGPQVGLPLGDAHDISNFVLGGEVQGEYQFNKNVSAIVSTGYSHFFGKDLGGGTKLNYGAIPILAGARYYPTPNFFIGGQVGYGIFTEDANGGGFAYKPQVGYVAGPVQLSLNYTGISNNGTISWLGLSGIFTIGK